MKAKFSAEMTQNIRRGPFQCPICYDVIKKPTMLKSCEHTFCKNCINQWIDAQEKEHTCPFCRQNIQLRKKPLIRIRPKYDCMDIPNQFNGSQSASLAALKEKLAAKTKELEAIQADDRLFEQKQSIELETVERKLEEVKAQLRPLQEQFSGLEKDFEQLHKNMPNLSFFNKIYAEVSRDPRIMRSTEPYDDIKEAWNVARTLSNSRHELNSKLNDTKKNILSCQRVNLKMRQACSEFDPEDFASRISWESFKRLCEVMGWKYTNYSHAKKDVSNSEFPTNVVSESSSDKKQDPRITSSFGASKRAVGASSFSLANRPNKIPKKTIGSLFNSNLLNDFDDDDVVELD